MRARIVLALLVVLAAVMTTPTVAPAQTGTRKVIRVVLTSFKFEPSLITVNRGDQVVLQLVNDDQTQRNHTFSAAFLTTVPFTVRGDVFRQGEQDGRRFVAVAPGKQAELEFVATQPGTFPFLCIIGQHAAYGMTGTLNVAASH